MNETVEDFPLEIEEIESSVVEEIWRYYKGERSGFVRVGPYKYVFPNKYCKEGVKIYKMAMRPDDVIVATYPRSGTTLTQEMVWLICNNLDYQKSAEIQLVHRSIFLELSMIINDTILEELQNEQKDPRIVDVLSKLATSGVDILEQTPSPRFIKTHLPFSLLPPNTIDTTKVVYVARDPRDVAVSFYHHNRLIRFHHFIGDFKTYWRHFKNNMYIYTPYFPHLKEAWALRNHPNMLFLFYYDIIKDMPSVIQRVSKFLGKEYTEEQVSRLCDHLDIKNFRNNKSCNASLEQLGLAIEGEEPFIRKGKSGGWRDYFDEEMMKEADEWMAENLKDTDLRFPST